MDYCAQINKISEYYKMRHDKALAMGINEGSKHYKAFKEIELRYQATEMAVEELETLKHYISDERFKQNVVGVIKLIVGVLTIKEQAINDEGALTWIQPQIVIRSNEIELKELYIAGQEAVQRLSGLDYTVQDRDGIYQEVLRYTFDIVNWLLAAREKLFCVGCGWMRMKEGE